MGRRVPIRARHDLGMTLSFTCSSRSTATWTKKDIYIYIYRNHHLTRARASRLCFSTVENEGAKRELCFGIRNQRAAGGIPRADVVNVADSMIARMCLEAAVPCPSHALHISLAEVDWCSMIFRLWYTAIIWYAREDCSGLPCHSKWLLRCCSYDMFQESCYCVCLRACKEGPSHECLHTHSYQQ